MEWALSQIICCFVLLFQLPIFHVGLNVSQTVCSCVGVYISHFVAYTLVKFAEGGRNRRIWVLGKPRLLFVFRNHDICCSFCALVNSYIFLIAFIKIVANEEDQIWKICTRIHYIVSNSPWQSIHITIDYPRFSVEGKTGVIGRRLTSVIGWLMHILNATYFNM